MIIEYIRYTIEENKQSEFEAAYARASVPLIAFTQCQAYELSHCVEEPQRYILRIVWDSLESHMKGFRGSPEFRDFFSHIRPYIENIEEMQHYELTTVVGKKANESHA